MVMQNDTAEQIEAELSQFTGSENLYRHMFGIRYTDGVRHLAERCKAYWLIDAIGSHFITKRRVRSQQFLIVRLQVLHRGTRRSPMARLTFHVDWIESNPEAYPSICTQRIEYTDMPLDLVELYLENGVLMLKRER